MTRNNFEFCYVIGKGGFGKVWKVRHKKSKQFYALKEMSKLKVLDKKSEKSINSEREFLSKLHNPFIVNMHYAFQDIENLYLVMDLMPGGDLRFHISRHKRFSEEQTRFFICGIIIALEYIHSNNVIHRDIKPENLVLDENGYVRLTDFGIAKENLPDNKSETSGTPGYMSPEVMKALNHSFPVDFFALGVIGYEFMKGERPYVGKNRKEIKEQILAKQAELKNEDIAEGWSKESADFINKLLIRKPENRIGYKGIKELKIHSWLKYYPWDMLYKKTLPSPFIPENKDNFDRRYCESSDVITEETKLRYEEILMDDIYKTAFNNFYYNTDDENKRKNKDKNGKIKNKNNENRNSCNNKIIINKNNKIITDMNNNINDNIENININLNDKNNKESASMKNSIKKISDINGNVIAKNHKKERNVITNNKNLNNNINTNIEGNVSNNVIYINFNINNPNLGGNIYNNQNISPKTDRVLKQYKNSAKNIYFQGNTMNNMNNNNIIMHKLGINLGSFVSPNNSVKKIKNNNGSENKNIIMNSRKNDIKNKYKKEIIDNLNDSNKINIIKHNKNMHNSMKYIYEQKNKTTILDTKEVKNLKNSEIISKRENTTSLNKSNNEIKLKKKDISHTNIFKDILGNEEKKENSNSNNSKTKIKIANINNSQTKKKNTNHYSKKKVLLKYHSPKDDKKNNSIINNSTSIHNIIKDKYNKNSRAYINNYNSNNIDISVNKSKTFLNDNQQTLKEIKGIKEIFKSTILKNKEAIKTLKNKSKNSIYINKNNIFNKDNNINSINLNSNSTISKININRNSQINLGNLKNKNSNFDHLKEEENLTKNINPNKNQTKNNIAKKIDHIESTKLIYRKNKNNNKLIFFSPEKSTLNPKQKIQNKQSNYQTNNLSLSSTAIKINKNKGISNSTVNIINFKNKGDESIRGYNSARYNENNNKDLRKSFGTKAQEINKKNYIFSYKQKPKSNLK